MPTELEKHLAGRIAGLAPDARRAVYDELRAGLQSEVRAAAPFMPVQTVVARRRELENAIIAVEKEAARSDPPRAFVPNPPKPAAPEPVPTEPVTSAAVETSTPANEPERELEMVAKQGESTPPAVAEYENRPTEARKEIKPGFVAAPAPESIAEITEPHRAETSAASEAPPEIAFEAVATEPFEEHGDPPPPMKDRRPVILYAGVLALALCAAALAAAIVGIGFEQATERAVAPAATSRAVPVTSGPAAELIKSAGFQGAAQEALKDGTAHLARREYDRAIASFDDAIRLDPVEAAAYGNRAFAHWNKGDTGAAIRDYGAAIERDPSNTLNRLNRAIAYNRTGDYQRAIDDLDRVIAAEPANANALNSRCWSRAVLSYLQEALADCDEALKLRPADPDARDSRGFVYLRLGRLDRAIADYNAVLKLQPRHAGSLYGRGLAKIGRGDRAGGNEDVTAARAIDPDIVATFARYGIR